MRTHSTLKAAALAGVCMLPLIAVAHAQDADGFDVSTAAPKAVTNNLAAPDNEVTVGVGGVSSKNAVFGRYNGLTDSGVGGWGSFNLNSRDAWDSGKTHYFSFTGDNLYFGNAVSNPSIGGLGSMAPEASLNMKVGDQGKWELNPYYDAKTYTWSDNFTTILDSAGQLNPGLAAAFARGGAYMNNATTLSPFYSLGSRGPATLSTNTGPALGSTNEFVDAVGVRRDKIGITGKYDLGNWLFTADIWDEHKQGSLESAMTTSGSNAGFIPFAQPVDYDQENYKVQAAYNTQQLQARIGYNFSNFIDHNTGFGFEGWNFVATNTGGVYNSYQESGVYSLPPSNEAHNFSGEIGYNLTPTTRFNATANYGLQLQNDAFSAATQDAYVLGNSTLAGQLASNPSSLSGVVQTFFGNATVTSHPMAKLNLKASYSIDMRSPEMSPQWIYGDATDGNALKLREAVQEQWTKQDMVLEAGYHVLDNTRVTLGYAYRDADRENAITHHTGDNEGSIKVNTMFTPTLLGNLNYVHAERTASAPDFSLWNLQINSDCGSQFSSPGLGCQQIPFYEAARTEDSISAMLNGNIRPDLSASLYGKFTNNQYHDDNALYAMLYQAPVGIDHDYSIQAGPNLSYHYAQGAEAHVFYTFLRTYRDMHALSNTPVGEYDENTTYDIQTAGIGGTWKVAENTKVGADYIFSYGNQAFNQSGIWNLNQGQAFGGDPNLNTNSVDNQFKIHATYDLTKTTQLYLAYEFDSLDMADWALTGASVGQVLTGDLPAQYNVSTVMAAVKMKW